MGIGWYIGGIWVYGYIHAYIGLDRPIQACIYPIYRLKMGFFLWRLVLKYAQKHGFWGVFQGFWGVFEGF